MRVLIRLKTRFKAILRILSCHDFILIEAKKVNGTLHSRISYRTDFDDIDEYKILKKYCDNRLKLLILRQGYEYIELYI